MKKHLVVAFALCGLTVSYGQENPEFIGENFSLEGALSMLKKSSSVEEFEQLINEEKNDVNNLDLNNDGAIDYITVEDVVEDNKHLLILTALVGSSDKQDVATITIEKTGNEEAQLQIFGDGDLYAANTIAEPFDVTEKLDTDKGPATPQISISRIVVNVWGWPSVRYIFAPGYRLWISPAKWAFYPRWWKPWKPFRYSHFIGRCHVHKVFIHRTPTRRILIHKSYKARRHSTTIIKRKRGTTTIHKGKRGKIHVAHKKRR